MPYQFKSSPGLVLGDICSYLELRSIDHEFVAVAGPQDRLDDLPVGCVPHGKAGDFQQ